MDIEVYERETCFNLEAAGAQNFLRWLNLECIAASFV